MEKKDDHIGKAKQLTKDIITYHLIGDKTSKTDEDVNKILKKL